MLLKQILEAKKIEADLLTSSEDDLAMAFTDGKIMCNNKVVNELLADLIEIDLHEIKTDLEDEETYNRGNTEYVSTEIKNLDLIYAGYNPDKDTLNLMFKVEWETEIEYYMDELDDLDDEYDVHYTTEYENYKGVAYVTHYDFCKKGEKGRATAVELSVEGDAKKIVKQFREDKVFYQDF